jgi:hypothetical protein
LVPFPATIEAISGVTMMPVRLGLVTLRKALPLMVPEVALIIERPAFTPLAKPALLISPAAGLLLDQVTVEVQSDSLLSE